MNENDIAIIPDEFSEFKNKCSHVVTYKNSDELCDKFGFDKSQIDLKSHFC